MPTAHEHITPAASPIAMAARGPTKPAAGVMPTRPATAPDATPSDVHLRVLNASVSAHPQAPAAAPRLVARKADAARPLAARALPALMWTRVPPAKSRAPSSRIHPPGAHTQWARGA